MESTAATTTAAGHPPPLDLTTALALVQELKTTHPAIPIHLRTDPALPALSACYIDTTPPPPPPPPPQVDDDNEQPGLPRPHHHNCLGLARPRTAADVASVVSFCAARALPLVVRAGGHDCGARTQVPGALMLDLRDLCHVRVGEDDDADEGGSGPGGQRQGVPRQRTARVGGGCLLAGLLAALEARGLTTPVGTISSVGYVGWAVAGGYGPLSGRFGLGVDQIVGARVVTAAGEVVEAEGELLRGLRGAAGALGVVVEVTIKVYPLDKVLAGCLIWPTGDDHQTFIKTFLRNLQQLYTEGLPDALNPLFSVWNHAQLSRCVIMMVTWAASSSSDDDHAEGRRWIARLAALGGPDNPTPAMDTIQPCTLLEGLRISDASVAPRVYGRCNTVTVRGTGVGETAFVDALAAHTDFGSAGGVESVMGVGVCLHRYVSPASGDGGAETGAKGGANSVWGPRESHTLMEIVSTTTDGAAAEAAFAWGCGLKRAVVEAVPGEVVGRGWLAMTPEEEVDNEKVFGDDYPFLLGLKRKWDPNNVFRHTVPKLPA